MARRALGAAEVSGVSPRGDTRPGAPPTSEEWERVRDAFRAEGTLEGVLKRTGLGRVRTESLLDVGAPLLGLPPIRTLVAEEGRAALARSARTEARVAEGTAREVAKTAEARLAAVRRSEEARRSVLRDAETQRVEEARLVRSNRLAAVALGNVNVRLLNGALSLAADLERLMSSPEALREQKIGPRERMGYLRTIAQIVQRTAEASQAAVKMERLLLGEPTHILGIQGSSLPSTEDMTPEEAEEWLRIANRAFARRAARGTVIPAEVLEEPLPEELTEPVSPRGDTEP